MDPIQRASNGQLVSARPVTQDQPNAPVFALLGPTASGKSAAAGLVAQQLPVEIISVDSAQVYVGMDIGTAKPSRAERAAIPHHLIDIIDPAQSYSAALFATQASQLIDTIRSRGKLPLIVGGTMLYAKALTQGLNNLPTADPAIRAHLDECADKVGWPQMHKRLAEKDPITAARLKPNDGQRIQRALEVLELTGKPMSYLLSGAKQPPNPSQTFQIVSLEPSEREKLHLRIHQRFHQMLDAGFIGEVEKLKEREDLHAGLPAIRSVGYRQLWDWLDKGARNDDREQAIAAGIAATRRLAKRQLTWLRSTPERTVIDCNNESALEEAANMIIRQASTRADSHE